MRRINVKKHVMDFISAKENLSKSFGLEGNYFISPYIDSKWCIKENDDFAILEFVSPNGRVSNAVVATKNGEPIIHRRDGYTIVVAIDCIKIAFLFTDTNKTLVS